MMHRLSFCLVIAAALATPITSAQAQVSLLKPAAKTKLERGMHLFEEKKYDDALRELRKGYAISEAREFLYAMGQIERIRGNWRAAQALYHAFLDSGPSADQAAAARVQIERCESELRALGEKVDGPKKAPDDKPEDKSNDTKQNDKAPQVIIRPQPEAPPQQITITQLAPEPEPPHANWYKDPLGGILFGTGLAAIGGGVAAFVVGGNAVRNGIRSNVNVDVTVKEYESARAAQWIQPVGIGVMAGGAALLAGSIIRYAIVAKNENAARAALSLSISDKHAMLVWGGAF